MPTPIRGEIVVLKLQGKVFNALVLATSNAGQDHLGEQGQPPLHLAYVPEPALDANTRKEKVMPIGYIPETLTILDVVHESHRFDADYLRQHGLRQVLDDDPNKVTAEAEIRNRRGAGEWREVTPEEAQQALDASHEQQGSVSALHVALCRLYDAGIALDKESARADKAEAQLEAALLSARATETAQPPTSPDARDDQSQPDAPSDSEPKE